MSNYGQDVLNEGLEHLEGMWSYGGGEYDLTVENMGYNDWKLVQQYAALSQQVATLEGKENIDDSDVEAVSKQAERLDNFSWEDDGDVDFVATLIENKLVEPRVDLDTTPSDKVSAIVEGMLKTWQSAKDVEEAREEMPLEGNP